jgi:hypothetical protein
MRDGMIFGAIVLLIVIGAVVVGAYLFSHVIREPAKYGNLSQAVQVLAHIVFGVSSLSAAFTVFTLQQNAGGDAALERAATLIARIHENPANAERWFDVDDATIANHAFDCFIEHRRHRLEPAPLSAAAILPRSVAAR